MEVSVKMATTHVGILALGALLAIAPQLQANEGKGQGKCDHMGMSMDSPKTFEHMKGMLKLTDVQVGKLEDVQKAQKPVMTALNEKMASDVKALDALVTKGATDAQLTAALDLCKGDHKAMQVAMTSEMEAMSAALTPLQRAKHCVHMMGEMKEMKGKMGKMNKAEKMKMKADAKEEKKEKE